MKSPQSHNHLIWRRILIILFNRDIWTKTDLYNDFKIFLEGSYNVENLMFFSAVKDYRTLDFTKASSSKKSDIRGKAKSIYQNYISDSSDSMYQVSINKDIRDRIKDKLGGKATLAADLFEDAEMEIKCLLKTSFSQFIHNKKN